MTLSADSPGRLDPSNDDGDVGSLDAVFEAGPDAFVDSGLSAFIKAMAAVDERESAPVEDPGVVEARFVENWATAMPPAYRRLLTVVAEAGEWPVFDGWTLASTEWDRVPPEGNVFVSAVCAGQRSFGMELAEVFCGLVCVDDRADTAVAMLAIYPATDPEKAHPDVAADEVVREFCYYGCEDVFYQAGDLADRLSTMLFAHALDTAYSEDQVSAGAYERGVRVLSGRVAVDWLSSIEDEYPDFVAYGGGDREHDGIRHLFIRSEWIQLLLGQRERSGRDLAEWIEDVFGDEFVDEDRNRVVTAEIVEARLAACASHVPTALYAMWRAYLFDEPELDDYLRVCASAPARLTRDCARLIEELCSGARTELGTITDVPAWLAEVRALGLDPRQRNRAPITGQV